MQDPELENQAVAKESLGTDNNPFTEGLYLLGLPKEKIDAFGLFFNDLYQKMRDQYRPRQITRNALTMMHGVICAVGSKSLRNPEWKEHCSTSLREILHEWKGNVAGFKSDFVFFYLDKNTTLTDKESQAFTNLKFYYGYFCGIVHHEASGIQNSLMSLLENPHLKLEDCYKDEIFLKQLKGIFSTFADIIEISKKNNQQ